MRNPYQLGELDSRSALGPLAADASGKTEHSAARTMRLLGRVIIGWLAAIIVIQLVAKSFGWD
jgi:hypothetical protein